MDCNKEEASRAKDIAELKMQSKDFAGAKKLLLKALNLFPEIENASHMLTVCEVHCSAGSLFNGQTDHYGILQVGLSADESLIRKQYRKLALLLHPDKNKFSGAEAAFKLVGEAYKILSDQTNRQVYDAKRRVQTRTVSTWQPSHNARNARSYTSATLNVTNNQFGGLKQKHQHPSSTFIPTQCFWTMCVFCCNRFQYARSWLNREVQCQKCFKKFLAFEVSPQNVPPPGSSSGFGWSRTGFPEVAIPAQHCYPHGTQTHASQSSKPIAATNNGFGSRNKEEKIEPCGDGEAGNLERFNSTQSREEPMKMTGNARRRNRRVVKSSDSDLAESDSSGSDSISEVDPTVIRDGPTSSRYPRRSNRHRVNVTYKEDESEDDFVRHQKRLRKVDSFGSKNQNNPSPVFSNGMKMKTSVTHVSKDGVEEMTPKSKEEVDKKDKQAGGISKANSAVSSSSEEPQIGSSFSYPDPELYDFEKDRDRSKFSANQIWAVYDDVDGMPRYYALIQKVFTQGFRLQYVWLEFNPASTAEKVWVKAGLPIACGNFRIGKPCSSESQEMFSHIIFSEKCSGSKYNIYPMSGEVWALFKDWDIGWSSAVEKRPMNYVYEFVEVVSNFAYGKDIAVRHLVKVGGFRYLFTRALDKEIAVMPSGQLLKFSHRIPYYKVCEEREGIPSDSFELDPAALPENLIDTVSNDAAELAGSAANNNNLRPSENVSKTDIRARVGVNSDDLLGKSDQVSEHQQVTSEAPHCSESRKGKATTPNLGAKTIEQHDENSSSNAEEGSHLEFYNFQDIRSEELFEQGQIWALYCDIDSYPKYYAWVKKVDWEISNIIHIKWLELQPTTNEEKLWSSNGLPFGCGRFKVVAGIDRFNSTDSFSHMVRARPIKKNSLYEIYPNSDEIWAVFKNWSVKWTSEDIRKATDFNVVEIIMRDESVIQAVFLTKVKGYDYVFRPETIGVAVVEIPMAECMMFSHQIPAFRLTNQESGTLKGYWELDPCSIPKCLLNMDP